MTCCRGRCGAAGARAAGRCCARWMRSWCTPRRAGRGSSPRPGWTPTRVHVIPHGAFEHLTAAGLRDATCARRAWTAAGSCSSSASCARTRGSTCWWRRLPPRPTTRSCWWSGCRACRSSRSSAEHESWGSPSVSGSCRASCPTRSWPSYFRRADVVVLPYREIEQSGVLYTALAFGSPLLLSAVGGFPEIAAHGAAQLVEPGNVESLRDRTDRAARRRRATSRHGGGWHCALLVASTPGTPWPRRPSGCTGGCWRTSRERRSRSRSGCRRG